MSWFSRMLGGSLDGPAGTISADTNGGIPSPPARFNTRWTGASQVVRSLASWWAANGSGKSDLNAGENRTLRARSRDAFRNHEIARAALTRARTNIIGTGLMCRPAVDYATLGLTADDAETIDAQLRASWARWADNPLECDAEATLDFYGLQSLALLSSMLSGDCFALTPFEQRVGGVSGLKVQLIEADRVENPSGEANHAWFGPSKPALHDGIELGELGDPIAVWIRNSHPGDDIVTARPPQWERFEVFGAATGRRRVMHVWNDKERPGQVRGAPFLAPVMEPLRVFSKWKENEMMAAVVSGLFTVFLKNTTQPAFDENGNALTPFGGAPTIPANADGTSPDPTTFVPPAPATGVSLGNGAVIDLPPGTEAQFANPSRPNGQFDPFFTACVKGIGAALEMPGDEILLTYAGSYTAARAAMLQAWRFYLVRRGSNVTQFSQPIYCLWLDEEVASGRQKLPGYADPIRRAAWSNAIWIGPARGAMDELREAQAAAKRIEIGVSNETIECAAMTGESRDQVYDQQVREINQRKADGTWELRPTGTIRVTPLVDPDHSAQPVTDPAAADQGSDDGADESGDVNPAPAPVTPPAQAPAPPSKPPQKAPAK